VWCVCVCVCVWCVCMWGVCMWCVCGVRACVGVCGVCVNTFISFFLSFGVLIDVNHLILYVT